MRTPTLEEQIQEYAKYIKNRCARETTYSKKAGDHKMIMGKLTRAERHLLALAKELGDLKADMRPGKRWHGYECASEGLAKYITQAREQAGKVLGPLADAITAAGRDPATREMAYQQMAVRNAFWLVDAEHPRQTRAVAREIMLQAGLPEPSDKSIGEWLKDLRRNGK